MTLTTIASMTTGQKTVELQQDQDKQLFLSSYYQAPGGVKTSQQQVLNYLDHEQALAFAQALLQAVSG